VREPPLGVELGGVLSVVQGQVDGTVRRVEHLPVGFGAHHWIAYDDRGPRLFVTMDVLRPLDPPERLEAAYAGAAALHERGLEFVVASLPTITGSFTVPFAHGVLSCTPWRDGEPGGPLDVAWTTSALARLHAARAPAGLPRWRPLVGPDLAETTATLTTRQWGPGPYADRARDAVRRHLGDLTRWTARYHHLAEAAHDRGWVATHGEPGAHNQLLTDEGRLLVDWESLQLAPAELDLRTLVDAGVGADTLHADRTMLELFDLEWRLDEISQYAAWFAAPHTGSEDDDIAFGGLLEELERT